MTNVKKLYELWCLGPTKEYAMTDVISVIYALNRRDVVNIDLSVLNKTKQYLQNVYPSEFKFEIREVVTVN